MTTTREQDLIDVIVADHREVETVFAELEVSGDLRSRRDLVEHVIDDVRHHITEEEADLLPRLRTACDADELRELGKKFQQSKKIAPTRPHRNT